MSIITAQSSTNKPDYSDLDLDFTAHPVTGDISRKFDDEAIARSIRNLILTNFYDRPFNPQIGSSAQKLLFENVTIMTAHQLRDVIIEVIQNYETRAEIIDVVVESQPDDNGYRAKIIFKSLNKIQPYQATVFLEVIN